MNFCFLISSPENNILDVFPSGPQVAHKDVGEIMEAVVDKDINRFIHHSLHKYTELELLWPNQEWCQLLVHHSKQLLLWATTMCCFIQEIGSSGLCLCKWVKIVLQSDNCGSIWPLDKLYQTILGELFPWDGGWKCFFVGPHLLSSKAGCLLLDSYMGAM